MILAALVSISIVVSVAVGSGGTPERGRNEPMTLQQKRAAVRPVVSSATECIARNVSADPRFADASQTGEVNDLIVDSVPSCLDAVRTMIDTYDRLFGAGAGETFFMGPYLDALPAAVHKSFDKDR
jgi:hypothetical protein